MKLEKNKLKIWKVEIDLKLWGIYLMLGAFIQLFFSFLIWKQNIALYTVNTMIGSTSAENIEDITSNAKIVLAICYSLFFIVNGKQFFRKLKKIYTKFKKIMEEEG